MDRVFVRDCDELTPDRLNRATGAMDSEDLPFDVSRDTLQLGRTLRAVRRNLVGEYPETFAEIVEDNVDYEQFSGQVGKYLKPAVLVGSTNQTEIVERLPIRALGAGDEQGTDQDCADRLKEGQDGNLSRHWRERAAASS